jgi:hypothetical protein
MQWADDNDNICSVSDLKKIQHKIPAIIYPIISGCLNILVIHKDISTTTIYAHLCPEDAIKEVRSKFGKRNQ